MKYSVAIFDLDGTLIESNSVWEKLDRIILERNHIACSDAFIQRLTAMSYEEAAATMRNIGLNISDSEFTRQVNELAEFEYAHNIALKDYAKEYLHYLNVNNTKIILATASPKTLYEPVLKHNKVFNYFTDFVTTDEVGKSKDYPDIYLKAAEKAFASPSECIVFEDIYKGVYNAKKTGMTAIGVYDKYSSDNINAIIEIADKFIYSFSEMLPI